MDFLDKLALGLEQLCTRKKSTEQMPSDKDLTNNSSEKVSETESIKTNTSSESAPKESTPTKRQNNRAIVDILSKRKSSYFEKNCKNSGGVFNDKYKKSNFRERHNLKDKALIYKILPFINHKEPFVEWVYRNRYGVFIIVGLYLGVLISVMTWRFTLTTYKIPNGVLIELSEPIIPEDVKEEEPTEQSKEEVDVSNLVSNEQGTDDGDDFLDQTEYEHLSDEELEQLLKEAEDITANHDQRMASYKEAIMSINQQTEIERQEAKNKRDSLLKEQEKRREHNRLQQGNVTVSYNLPGRRALKLEIPAYRCEGGGKVVVEIEVSRAGKVTSAKVKQSFGVKDPCVTEMAVWASGQTEFSVDQNAPYRQKGIITYIFVAQHQRQTISQ